MEIIGDMKGNFKMVSVTEDELAMLMGFRNIYDDGFRREMITTGKIIDIAKFVKISTHIKTLNTSYLSKIAKDMDNAGVRVREAIAMADELNCFEKLKD